MTIAKDSGLAAIARSSRKAPDRSAPSRGKPVGASPSVTPALELEGRQQKTSLALDVGLWDCVLETAHVLTKRMRSTGRGRVTLVDVLETAFVAFNELPIEQQLERVRKHQ